ncbi:ABC transporter ATP-binding protein [Cellulomonas sp. RIT-PI-Y]|uniref:ABC transporter ATP-binding protein n=1 Tax=Cellulomonas sp. RIT-PI-Y TaxID=3035297 RepID=UPI0021D86E1B|nr:ABC transporter ATP-binding protein [Cellulomonas sp. RIT-PI-Y]
MTVHPILELAGVDLAYGKTTVVHGLDLAVAEGASLALIGESGSGKSTAARAALGLLAPGAGEVRFRGTALGSLDAAGRRAYRGAVQPVFQDGPETLDPRQRVGSAVAEGLRLPRDERRTRVRRLLTDVGLDPELAERRPHELSGGQRQRVGIARALAVDPALLVLDEPTSALDVTVQARILDLLDALRAERGIAMLLITHNLAVVDRLCDDAVVLEAGRVVERGPARRVLDEPQHPYTAWLRAAVPELGGTLPGLG